LRTARGWNHHLLGRGQHAGGGLPRRRTGRDGEQAPDRDAEVLGLVLRARSVASPQLATPMRNGPPRHVAEVGQSELRGA